MRSVAIGNRLIGKNNPTYVVAEIGTNHENRMDFAEALVRKAAEAGANAVKFQLFAADSLVTRSAKIFWEVGEQKPHWFKDGTQYEEYAAVNQLTRDEYRRLHQIARESGLDVLDTAFDYSHADFAQELRVDAFKVASCDITNFPLLQYLAKKGKPIVLSTGASTIAEIAEAVDAIQAEGNNDIVLLHCILNYPTADDEINLGMMCHMQRAFPDFPVGLSDHTIPDECLTIPLAAAALGARLIEKHFTLDKNIPGNDHFLSADFEDMRRLIRALRTLEKAMGDDYKGPLASEADKRLLARRSIVATTTVPEGTVITAEMLTCKRPGTGIPPRFFEWVIGRKARQAIEEDSVLTFDMV